MLSVFKMYSTSSHLAKVEGQTKFIFLYLLQTPYLREGGFGMSHFGFAVACKQTLSSKNNCLDSRAKSRGL